MIRTLRDLEVGSKGIIKKVNGGGRLRRRITDMGLVPGVEVEMERYAPMGNPVEVKVRNSHISLRKEEAAEIVLE